MNHGEFRALIDDYILGKIDDEQIKITFEKHFFGCQSCFKKLEFKKEIKETVDKMDKQGDFDELKKIVNKKRSS
jgi:hypothetical protein